AAHRSAQLMKVTVLGAGAWGTALAKILHQGGHAVTLWGHNPTRLEQLRQTGRNERYLPGVELPRDWKLEPDTSRAVAGAEFVIVAVPSRVLREATAPLADFAGTLVSVTKGIEHETGLTMCGILGETAPKSRRVALSGPTFALEVARGIPTACVAASADAEDAA